jgi:hypothetical protein
MGYIASVSDTDRADRREVQIAATLRSDAGPQDIALVDLSATGFRAKLVAPLTVGAMVTVGTRSLGVREATIVWTNGSICGVEFVVPLTHQQVVQAREIDTVVEARFETDAALASITAGEQLPARTRAGTARRLPMPARMTVIVGLSALGWAGIAAIVLMVRAAVI